EGCQPVGGQALTAHLGHVHAVDHYYLPHRLQFGESADDALDHSCGHAQTHWCAAGDCGDRFGCGAEALCYGGDSSTDGWAELLCDLQRFEVKSSLGVRYRSGEVDSRQEDRSLLHFAVQRVAILRSGRVRSPLQLIGVEWIWRS